MQTTLGALGKGAQQAGRTDPSWADSRSQNLYGQQTAEMGAPAMRGLAEMEPSRLLGLLDLMSKEYSLGGNIYGDYLQTIANLRNQDLAKKQAQRQILGGIPIVGGLVAAGV